MTDSLTQRWIRCEADEIAVSNGCRFDEKQGQFVVDWIQSYCTLYEGEWAGQKMELRDWQYEATMRMFGWMQHSDHWQREVRRFRQACIYLPKKQGKSPTLSAWGLYLLCGDGEQGQKVFFAAKDGQQAREIAGKHAIEMLMQSEELMSECTINKTMMQITHEPSRSIMKPLSSSNSRTQESKEGLNGSLLVDETHVVDWPYMKRINRMGISRSEPFHIEVSTAGNNPDGYGFDRFQYAKQVESGEQRNDKLFTMIYAAPQDVTDDEIKADPMKFGRMANPKFGHTVDPQEYMDDFNRSQRSITDFAEFKMYRLNIWQAAAQQWLNSADWAACQEDFTAEQLEGRTCYGGLDLSWVKDMTAFVLIFPDADGEYRLLPWFFLPESQVDDPRLKNYDLYQRWIDENPDNLILCQGDTIDQDLVRQHIVDLSKRFNIQCIAYDEKLAQLLVDKLVSEDRLNCERMNQSTGEYAMPTDHFEKLVIEHKLRHNGHPVMNWQIGHVEVIERNGYQKPVKPKRQDHRKVDGVQAAVMALAAAMHSPGPSVYETRGMLSV